MNDRYREFENRFKGQLLKEEPLKRHTSFKIGGPADLMAVATKKEDLIEAVTSCLDLSIPYFILGGGTNLVFHDRGFRGVVIKNLCSGYRTNGKYVYVESGANLRTFAGNMSLRGLKGLENLAGIPGTVGGAIVGNAGAYGRAIGDILESAEVFFLEDKTVRETGKDFFDFKYRYSSMKNGQGSNIILSAKLRMDKGDRERAYRYNKKRQT